MSSSKVNFRDDVLEALNEASSLSLHSTTISISELTSTLQLTWPSFESEEDLFKVFFLAKGPFGDFSEEPSNSLESAKIGYQLFVLKKETGYATTDTENKLLMTIKEIFDEINKFMAVKRVWNEMRNILEYEKEIILKIEKKNLQFTYYDLRKSYEEYQSASDELQSDSDIVMTQAPLEISTPIPATVSQISNENKKESEESEINEAAQLSAHPPPDNKTESEGNKIDEAAQLPVPQKLSNENKEEIINSTQVPASVPQSSDEGKKEKMEEDSILETQSETQKQSILHISQALKNSTLEDQIVVEEVISQGRLVEEPESKKRKHSDGEQRTEPMTLLSLEEVKTIMAIREAKELKSELGENDFSALVSFIKDIDSVDILMVVQIIKEVHKSGALPSFLKHINSLIGECYSKMEFPSLYSSVEKPSEKSKNSVVKEPQDERQKHLVYLDFNQKLIDFVKTLKVKLPHNAKTYDLMIQTIKTYAAQDVTLPMQKWRENTKGHEHCLKVCNKENVQYFLDNAQNVEILNALEIKQNWKYFTPQNIRNLWKYLSELQTYSQMTSIIPPSLMTAIQNMTIRLENEKKLENFDAMDLGKALEVLNAAVQEDVDVSKGVQELSKILDNQQELKTQIKSKFENIIEKYQKN